MILAVLTIGWAPRARAQPDAAPSSIVIDAATGRVLSADRPDETRFPASLTKLMTLFMTFEALRDHRITLRRRVPVSAHAAAMEPTKLWLQPQTHVTVEQCILGMITVSANDAAAAIGELLGGSERRFARMMTLRAHALGMRHTVFRNASGLPDPAQVTTARDMAVLARALIRDFPGRYHYFAVRSFVFGGRTVFGHDPMLDLYPGADGMKTGYTSAAGHNLATSAVRDGRRLIGIVLGAPTNGVRDAAMIGLLDRGFGAAGTVLAAARRAPATGLPALLAQADAAELVRPVLAQAPPVHLRPAVAARRPAARPRRTGVHGHTVLHARHPRLERRAATHTCAARGHRRTRCMTLRRR